MGEANFYYFTCLKLHLVFSGLQLFEREMANSLAIVLVLATIAHLGSSRMMTGDWASKVCAAYYKASELGAFPPVYPGGLGWNDKVCLADPSFYLECKFVNGVFVGEKRQCPPGKLFYHGANQMWEKTCVPADKCNTNKQCPDWLGMMPPSPVLTECQRQRESALKFGNYAPSCDINGNFKPLQCGAGFCWCVYADGTKIPNTKCDMALSALTDAKCLLHRKEPDFVGAPMLMGPRFLTPRSSRPSLLLPMPNAPSTGLHLQVPLTASNPFNAAPDFVGALLLTEQRSPTPRLPWPSPH